MNPRKIRLLLWCGCLGAVILFAGDILFYGEWGSARVWSDDYFLSMMAHVAPWRHHLGSITGPVGVGFMLLGMLGLWFCCRRAAPHLAAVMLAFFMWTDFSGFCSMESLGRWDLPSGFAAAAVMRSFRS